MNVLTAVAAVCDMIWKSGNCDACQSSREPFVLQHARYHVRESIIRRPISHEKSHC